MPKAKPKKPVQPVAPTPPAPAPAPVQAEPAENGLPVVYDKLNITEYSTASPVGPLTVADQKGLLGWETEKEYQQRKVRENPSSKPEHWLYGDVYHCKNVAGEKVRCTLNANNRPFDMGWCEDLIHTIMYGQWAGPFTIPGETINGETIRVSRYGRVLSGQHQMTACILAGEHLAKARQDKQDHPDNPKYPVWRAHSEPFLETIVVVGMSEDPRVLMTVDYVKPRTAADVFYTSEVFKSAKQQDRKELCRILASAADVLWTRTDTHGYKTHPELVAFLERHRRLLDCVLHLFSENSVAGGRRIGKLRLQPGVCAALMYVMGSAGSKTDGDVYRNENPPSEKNLDWSLWDKAEEFWTLLAGGRDFVQVRVALGRLVDSTASSEDNQGMGGRGPEKLAVLAKAWERWKDHPDTGGPPFDDADLAPDGLLHLSYSDLDDKGNRLPDGQVKLLDVADFYGIDCPVGLTNGKGRGGAPMPPAPTREEIERAMEEAQARRRATPKT